MILSCFSLETFFQPFYKKQVNTIYSKEDKLIQSALRCLEERFKYQPDKLADPFSVRKYLQLQLAQEQNEIFAVLFLNNSHHVIAFEKLFYGTINSTTVHPRVVAQRALALNAAAVILTHNHPSGNLEPSAADQYITNLLKQALILFDVRVLDHIIVSHEGTLSFTERGLI